MTEIRKDHSLGAGTGAVAGAVAGAAVGAVGGPIGIAAGAVVGGVLGATAGDSLAEAVNPTEYADHWKTTYQTTPYFTSGREWTDYEPAYQLGYDAYGKHHGRAFDDIEADLQRNWDASRGKSRLEWIEAKGAVRDGRVYMPPFEGTLSQEAMWAIRTWLETVHED